MTKLDKEELKEIIINQRITIGSLRDEIKLLEKTIHNYERHTRPL